MIENSVLEAICGFSLIKENSTVTVALSGGADSMALLNVLVALKDRLKITVKAAHLNHLIRGDEAFRDENFVKVQCALLNVPLFLRREDVPEFAKANNLSLELAARKVRYSFFEEINEGVIATAHTASDNLETVIFNLTRGTSIDGLCGIPAKRDNIIRPLILCTREMIEEYCIKNNISYVTDSTNLSDEYSRNKIRHSVIPVLKSLNPSVEKTVLRSSFSLKEIADDVSDVAKSYLKENLSDKCLSLAGFAALQKSVAKRIIVEFVKKSDESINLESCHIEEIYRICINGGKTSIPKNCCCLRENNTLKIIRNDENNCNLSRYEVKISEISKNFYKKNQKVNNLLLNNCLDYDRIVGNLVVRTRKSGDTIRLVNRGCTKPLTKLFNELSIPVEERSVLPVISDDKGIVWIYGVGVAQRCAVTAKTERFCHIDVTASKT